MMGFIVDLFPQATGSPSVPSPPSALLEDFFSSSAPSSSLIYLKWFERVWSALSEADTRLVNFVTSGHGDFLLLSSRSPFDAFHWTLLWRVQLWLTLRLFLLSGALNPRIMWVFLSTRLRRSRLLCAPSLRLSALLGFVRLQNFTSEDSALFNTIVTSLSKSLAHQANMTATHTAFLGLKSRQFYLPSSFLFFRGRQACYVVFSC